MQGWRECGGICFVCMERKELDVAKKKVPKRDLNLRIEMLEESASPGTVREAHDSTMATHSTVIHRRSKSRTKKDWSGVSPTLDEAGRVFAYTYHRIKPS